MLRLSPWLSTPLTALVISLGASGLGLAVNALRPDGIALVAAFPYVQDCPQKIDLSGPTVPPERVRGMVGNPAVLFLDARPPEAFAQGHILGARSLPFSFLSPVNEATATGLGRFEHVIVYCDSADDQLARLQAKQLRALGLKQVKILAGGWPAFQRKAPP